jgi:hypothetical protein
MMDGMINHKALRPSATLLFVGTLIALVAGLFHPSRQAANDHAGAFAEYATSAHWTAIHVGQFAGMAVIIAGLVVLFVALNVQSGTPDWAGVSGVSSAVVTLALYGVLQAVDGVALKQAVDTWAHASDADRVARFASAEAIRWLEWGVRSYQSFMLGVTFLLFALTIMERATVPKPIGYLMALSGLAYLAQGWVLGAEGFSAHNTAPTLLGIVSVLIWSVWLLIAAWGPIRSEPHRVA